VGFEVLTASSMTMAVLWVVAQLLPPSSGRSRLSDTGKRAVLSVGEEKTWLPTKNNIPVQASKILPTILPSTE
jgi:hypothetical protein